jgi:hypothetical protein
MLIIFCHSILAMENSGKDRAFEPEWGEKVTTQPLP